VQAVENKNAKLDKFNLRFFIVFLLCNENSLTQPIIRRSQIARLRKNLTKTTKTPVAVPITAAASNHSDSSRFHKVGMPCSNGADAVGNLSSFTIWPAFGH
jgi:hypothetical protein